MTTLKLNLQSVFFATAVALASILAASPSDVAFAAAPKATAGKMKASLEALRDGLNGRDKDKIVRLYADDATIEDPAGSPLKIGKAAIDAFYGSAIDRGITMDIIKVEELPDQKCSMEANIHVGTRVVHTRETYLFKPDGKIAAMKSMPAPKKIRGRVLTKSSADVAGCGSTLRDERHVNIRRAYQELRTTRRELTHISCREQRASPFTLLPISPSETTLRTP